MQQFSRKMAHVQHTLLYDVFRQHKSVGIAWLNYDEGIVVLRVWNQIEDLDVLGFES